MTSNMDTASPAPAISSSSSSSIDNLSCLWANCNERCSSPEALYDHVCERHVGRKSTNNLNLQCQWATCRTTTVKRDHITSHIRVHVPLKPHKCDVCGKSFKRPQDLKKHVKTHADESVLLSSPEPAVSTDAQRNGYGHHQHHQNGVAKQSSYHTDSYMGGQSMPSYGYTSAPITSHMGYGNGGGLTTAANYGPVYYNVPQAAGFNVDGGLTESRKRNHDALNDFFAEAKRSRIDPGQYQDLGSRFGNFLGMYSPPGVQTASYGGMGMGMPMSSNTADDVSAMAYQTSPQMQNFSQQYSLPFSELRTKNDLMSIDHFLEQLQSTVYEHSDFVQPVRSPTAQPPRVASVSSTATTPSSVSGGNAYSTSSVDDVPALTPSYHPSNSPASTHSAYSQTPPSMHAVNNQHLYPVLPSINTGYTSSMGASTSGLGSSFDDTESRRRWSNGFLQRAAPARDFLQNSHHATEQDTKMVDRDATPKASPTQRNMAPPKLPGVAAITAQPSSPRRNSADSPSVSSETSSSDERQEAWVQNMRIIEALRDLVKHRLAKGEYEGNSQPTSPRTSTSTSKKDTNMVDRDAREEKKPSLYPMLRPVEA